MVNLGALWRKAAALLQQAGIEDAAFDARELCRMCCGADPLCAPQAPVSEAARRRLAQLCARRAQHEPLQYLLGEWDFLDFTVEVGPGVLIPRPDTECVAETAMAALRRRAAEPGCVCAPAALDLCAGTGVLAIAMARRTGDGGGKKRRGVSLFAAQLRRAGAAGGGGAGGCVRL